jgi:membrane-bound lytic murein transglycosylase B
MTAPAPTAARRRRRVRLPYTHALRRLPTSRAAAATAARSLATWSRQPTGRLVLPGLLLLALVTLAGTAGAYLVPVSTGAGIRPAPSPSAPAAAPATTRPEPVGQPGLSAPSTAPTVATTALPTTATPTVVASGPAGRPADALAGWARQAGTRVGIPVVAMQAYGYAELVVARTIPGCRLSWTTLAAIGRIESNHGSANNAVLRADGQAQPPIVGLPLDGLGGRQRIADTDDGALDGDRTYDRAVGPMQFIPGTWARSGVDADNDGAKDPNDIDDAALAAANYLCASNRNMATAADWWNAILSYNDVRQYAQDVFNAANDYGVRSRT